ncbi:MAG: hypothetical protein KA527_01600 [Cytophagaceae bacterium]|nr:hypothetical protein [Cytophagaceae bacterium]MBP6092752.1 hypothetical protein [Cytophagaceae bacterium]
MVRFFTALLFLLFFSNPIKALSEFEWYDLIHQHQVRINLVTNYLEVKEPGRVWLKKNKLTFNGVLLSDLPPYCKASHFNLKNKQLISLPGTGQVYHFDSTKNVLERLDKTFFRGYNFHALQFVRNDTLFSLGGEGFWRSNSILSFFDFKNKEWEEIKTKGDIPRGVISFSAGIQPNQRTVLAVEAFHQGDYQVRNLGYYALDLLSLTWEKKGDVDLFELKKLGQTNANFVQIGNLMFLNDPQIGFYVDAESNKIYRYIGPKKLFFLIESELFLRGNQIISKQHDKNSTGNNFKIDSMSMATLRRDSQFIGSFYEEVPMFTRLEHWLIGISLCLLISLGLNFRFLLKKNTIVGDISLANIPIGGTAFIELFKVHGEDYLVSTEEISIILGCEKKAFDTQRQYRAQFINAMNQYFADHYQIEEAVFRKADEDDKRFIKYGLKKEALE